MFEKFFPKSKKITKEKNPKIEDTIADQLEVGKTDLSVEDFHDRLNKSIETRKILGGEEPVTDTYSREEIERDNQLGERLHQLRIGFAGLKEEIKERQTILNELRYSKSGIDTAVRNLNFKDMNSKERNIFVVETMRNAEDRLERINHKIKSNEIEIVPLYQELGHIEEMIKSLAILMNNSEQLPDKTIAKQGYDFNQN